jgi:hypothetical protein
MNIFQLQERIKDFSKDQLVKEMQQPSGAVPPFLVLSELQRRTRMEKAFQAEQAQGQQSTVAQDAIAAAGVPQGGIADMAQAMAPQTDMAGNTGAMPVQTMYGGGEVKRMRPGGLLRSTGNAELDEALAELERQRLRQEEDEEGLSEVSADVGDFMPGALGSPRMPYSRQPPLSRVDPNVAAPRTAPGLPSIRPTDAQPILNELAPPAFRDIAAPTNILGPEQGPQLPATGAPTDFPAQLINRDGERLVLLPDGSAVSPEQLGITPGDLAGAGTADLAGPAAFTDPIYPAFPTQGDLDLRFAEEQRDTAARDAAAAADVEADTARRYIAQTFENEANRDTVEKLTTPIPGPAAPFDPFEYMRGGTEVGPAVDPFDPAVSAARIERELQDPTLSPARREALESQLAGVRRFYDTVQNVEGTVAGVLGTLGQFDAASSNRLGRLMAGLGFPDAGTSLIERGQRMGEAATTLRTGEGFVSGEAGDLDDGSPLAPKTAIVPQTPDAETPRPVPRPDRSTTPPAGGGAGGTGGTGGAGARATSTADADKWLALAQFGLGLMASQAPTLGGAIGEAGTMALSQLRESQKEAFDRDLAERTLAARSARDRDGLSASNIVSLRADLVEQLGTLTDGLRGTPTEADITAAAQLRDRIAGLDRLLGLDAIGGLGAVSADSSKYRLPSVTQ